ncbi:MAG: hypothetical protein DRH26_16635 [Deltaproteobacteria bacterium]|nr:MAG: hypothetical protein DRH26_16635 [Deltaproteobacteria bacterium]
MATGGKINSMVKCPKINKQINISFYHVSLKSSPGNFLRFMPMSVLLFYSAFSNNYFSKK